MFLNKGPFSKRGGYKSEWPRRRKGKPKKNQTRSRFFYSVDTNEYGRSCGR
jgi:hypothetical protein